MLKVQCRILGVQGMRPPGGPNSIHAVFEKLWQNRMLAPLEDWRPHLREILVPPLNCEIIFF